MGTRESLLDVAEQLFAQRGLHGVALREIGMAAGQRNNGATQYHFGDKAGLVRAVFERRAAIVNQRRLALLDPGCHDVRGLIAAFVIPLAEQVEAGNWYVSFLARLQADHERDALLGGIQDAKLNAGHDKIRNTLRRGALSGLPTELFGNRWRLAVNLSSDALADHQARTASGERRILGLDMFVSELIDAISGLLTAPSNHEDRVDHHDTGRSFGARAVHAGEDGQIRRDVKQTGGSVGVTD